VWEVEEKRPTGLNSIGHDTERSADELVQAHAHFRLEITPAWAVLADGQATEYLVHASEPLCPQGEISCLGDAEQAPGPVRVEGGVGDGGVNGSDVGIALRARHTSQTMDLRRRRRA
jgi:hypothetical protein